MKIGILSMQKILNYGSFLQAFSLKLQMEKRGHEVYFIDIIPGRQIIPNEDKLDIKSICSKFDRYVLKRIENYLLSKRMQNIHINDYEMYLDTDKSLNDKDIFDLVIIGSDEVFNAIIPSRWGFTTQLFGDVKNSKKVVTYAASCGSTSFDDVEKYDLKSELINSMNNLKCISVRDENTADFVEKIIGIKPMIHVDPVFLSNYDKYIPEVSIKKPYMLVYAYANRINNADEIKAIKMYAKKNKLEIVCVGMQQRWCNKNIPATAFELLAYVKGSECIVTDTFHGTVFSIKYNKKFVTFVRKSNYNKLVALLDAFGLGERAVKSIDQFNDILEKVIDYKQVNNMINNQQFKSYEYLDDICKLGDCDE